MTKKRAFLLILMYFFAALLGRNQAMAQASPPMAQIALPVFTAIDSNDVDILSRALMKPLPPVTIGADSAGLSEKTSWINGLGTYSNIALSNSGIITYTYTFTNRYGQLYGPTQDGYTVSIGANSENFFYENGVFVPQIPDGASLVYANGAYTYTMTDGSVAIFGIVGFPPGPHPSWSGTIAFVTQIAKPDGEIKTFAWTNSIPNYGNYALTSVSSNYGYQLNYGGWGTLGFNIIATNTAAKYCSPTAATCPSTGPSTNIYWPVGNFTFSASAAAYSDTLNNVTTLTFGPVTGSSSCGNQGSPCAVTASVRPNDASSGTDVTYGTAVQQFNPQAPSTLAVSSVTDLAGTWSYTASSVTDPLGHKRVILTTTNTNQISSDTDADGNQTQYQYDANYHLTSVTHPSGIVDQYAYDSRGNVITHTKVAIPGSGLANIVESAVFPSTCTNTATCNKPTAVIDANGHESDYTYDPNSGLILTKTLPASANGVRPQMRYTYEQLRATYYDTSGQLDQGSPIWKLWYTSTCQTQSTCSGTADEVRTTYTYDCQTVASGTGCNLLPVSVTTAAGDGSLSRTVTTTYDALGNATSVTEPKGSANTPTTTVYIYDADRRKIGEIGPAPTGNGHYRATRSTYDKDGNVVLTEQGWTTSQTDTTLSSFTSLEQHATAYDTIDRKTQDTTSGGGTTYTLTQYGYDAANRLQCSTVRMNAAVFSSLPASACSLGTQGSDGPDRVTYNSYDPADRLLQVTSGYGTSLARNDKTLTYTSDDLVLTQADGKGNLTTNVYDGFDRLSRTFYPNPSNGSSSSTTDYEQYGYDAASNMLSDRRRDGNTLSMTYDALNREITKAGPGIPTVYNGYDLLSRKTSVTYNSATGPGNAYTYDALGRVTSASTYSWPITFQYDLAGDRTSVTWWDGFFAAYGYDTDGEVTTIKAAPNAGDISSASTSQTVATYSYDDLGRRTGISRGDGVSTSYGYDGISRLTSLTHTMVGGDVQSQTYGLAYTASSQIKTLTQSNGVYQYPAFDANLTYTVNGQNQLTSSGGATIGYDARGNLNSDGVTTYTYDVLNRLVSTGAGVTTVYDPEDRLLSITQSGTTTQFAYAGANVAADFTASTGVILRHYLPGPDEDQPVIWYYGSGLSLPRWLLQDHQGSVVAVTDMTGGAIAINTYNDYGSPGSSNLGRYQFTGQFYLPEVGLYDYKARLYSPIQARFMQTDPVGYKDGLNWYDYVHNDPVNRTDPTGDDGATLYTDPSLVMAAPTPETPTGRALYVAALAAPFALEGAAAEGIEGAAAAFRAVRFASRLDQVRKFLKGWEETPNKKGTGSRFQDPNDKGSRVRVDKGDPNNKLPTQQVDHVVQQQGGKTVDRSGVPIDAPKPTKTPEAHIPLVDWIKKNIP